MSAAPTQEWFEMRDVRRRSLSTAVWIPLAATQSLLSHGEKSTLGYQGEYFTCDSLAVPMSRKAEGQMLTWEDDVDAHSHAPEASQDHYTPADIHEDYNAELMGVRLAIRQHLNSHDPDEWHLHQDLVIALHLKREGDSWVCPREGYAEVARLKREKEGWPVLLEIKAEFLRDYLCARNMGLFVGSFQFREAMLTSKALITWPANPYEEKTDFQRWEGHVGELNVDGSPMGNMAFIHVGRKDVDFEEDIPQFGFPTDDEVVSESWEREATDGPKMYLVEGRLWRSQWLDPAPHSPRVRGDKLPGSIYFITDTAGNRETKDTLKNSKSRWLWFRPQVINDILKRRGSQLQWYTRQTGRIDVTRDDYFVFGLNSIGLLNVYAKDIALLPDWQQQIWSGYCVSPDGKVSSELLMSQMQATPADTQAPEPFLGKGIDLLNQLTQETLDFRLFRHHDDYATILASVHRFRAIDEAGLFTLAKDVARLTADSIDAANIQKHLPKGDAPKSLKALEKLLATKIDPAVARSLLTPLVGTYELRLADAHLPSSKINEAFELVGIDKQLPFVWQGEYLLAACVGSLYRIAAVIQEKFIDPSAEAATTTPADDNA